MFNKYFFDQILVGSTDDAVSGLFTLVRKVGLLCGPTSGLAYKKTVDYLSTLQRKKPVTAVFIACDRLEPYMSYIKRFAPQVFGKQEHLLHKVSSDFIDEISPAELQKEIDSCLVVDVRLPQAFAVTHMKNSVNIPLHHIEELCKFGVPFSRDKKIVVVCAVGVHSRKVAAAFNQQGYRAVSLEGGFTAWRKMKLSVCTASHGDTHTKE